MERAELIRVAEAAEAEKQTDRAIEHYRELERIDPDDPTWACRLAEIYRHKNDRKNRCASVLEAALRFYRSGVPMKAVAMARLALSLDPKSPETMEVLKALQGGQAPPASAAPPSPPPAPKVETTRSEAMPGIVPLARRQSVADAAGPVPLLEPAPGVPPSAPKAAPVQPGIPLFSEISSEAFRSVLVESRVSNFKPGQVIFTKGEASLSLCVIVDGKVDVFFDENEPASSQVGAGEFFGEMGVFTGKPRGATVKAATDVELLEVDIGAIAAIVRSDPATLRILLRFFGERLMNNVLARAPLFSELAPEERQDLRSLFTIMDVKRHAVIIQQGELSQALFVLIDGAVAVERQEGEAITPVAMLVPGDMFGEISVLTQLPAVATVRAEERCLLLALPAARMHEVADKHPALLDHARTLAGERMLDLKAKNNERRALDVLGT